MNLGDSWGHNVVYAGPCWGQYGNRGQWYVLLSLWGVKVVYGGRLCLFRIGSGGAFMGHFWRIGWDGPARGRLDIPGWSGGGCFDR